MDIRAMLEEKLAKREEDRLVQAASLVETAIEQAVDQAANLLDPHGSQPSVPADDAPPAVPGANPAFVPQDVLASGDALIAHAARELSRFRPGSESWFTQLERSVDHLANLTGMSRQEVANKLAETAQAAQPGGQPVDNDNQENGARNWLRNLVSPDDHATRGGDA